MENNSNNKTEDRGALAAILLTIAIIAVMAILKHFIG